MDEVHEDGFSTTSAVTRRSSYAQIIHAGLSVNYIMSHSLKIRLMMLNCWWQIPHSLVSQTRVVTDNSDVSRMWKGGVCESLSCSCLTGSFSSLFFLSVRFSVCAKLGRKSSRSDLERLKGGQRGSGPCGSSGAKTTCLYNFIYTL